jgi:hypothetical protein
VTVDSPFRAIVEPICHYLDEIETEDEHLPTDERRINVVMIPEYAGRHWWDRILHNGNGKRLRETLLGRRNTVILDIPYRRDLEEPAPGNPLGASPSPTPPSPVPMPSLAPSYLPVCG